MEQWADIKGFEGYYKVSNYGRVFSVRRNLILAPATTTCGYKVVSLCKRGYKQLSKVHRLVATAFIPNHRNIDIVNHIDSDKANNHYTNLEWCTPKENAHHGIKYGKMGSIGGTNHNAKIALHVETGIFFDCLKDAAHCFGYNYSTLKNMTNGNNPVKYKPLIYV